jgi:hypothetical protein
MNDAILRFCPEAVKQGVHDKDSGSLVREFNVGTADQIVISLDWPAEAKYTIELNTCLSRLAVVMDSCDGNNPNNPNNPMNRKHGGRNVFGYTSYNIFPSNKGDRYKPGVFSVHIAEIQAWKGNDILGQSRKYEYYINSNFMDNDGTRFAGNSGGHLLAGDGNHTRCPRGLCTLFNDAGSPGRGLHPIQHWISSVYDEGFSSTRQRSARGAISAGMM